MKILLKRLWQEEEGQDEIDKAEAGSYIAGQLIVVRGTHAAYGRSEHETQSEGSAHNPHALRSVLSACDIGDISLGNGQVGVSNPGNDAGCKQQRQRAGHAPYQVADSGCCQTGKQNRTAPDIIR